MLYQITQQGLELLSQLTVEYNRAVPMTGIGSDFFFKHLQESRTGEGIILSNDIQELWILHALASRQKRVGRARVNKEWMEGQFNMSEAQTRMDEVEERYPHPKLTKEQIGNKIPRPYKVMGMENYGFEIDWSLRLDDLVESGFILEIE